MLVCKIISFYYPQYLGFDGIWYTKKYWIFKHVPIITTKINLKMSWSYKAIGSFFLNCFMFFPRWWIITTFQVLSRMWNYPTRLVWKKFKNYYFYIQERLVIFRVIIFNFQKPAVPSLSQKCSGCRFFDKISAKV